MSETIFEIKDLVKKFRDVTALDHINTSIKKGEVLFLVGPSGSGKSTLLRCLNLLEKPTSGQIIFKGKDVNTGAMPIDKLRQQLGMVFQHFNLFPNLTIHRNITLAPVKTGRATPEEAAERADMLLKRIGLYDKRDAAAAKDAKREIDRTMKSRR